MSKIDISDSEFLQLLKDKQFTPEGALHGDFDNLTDFFYDNDIDPDTDINDWFGDLMDNEVVHQVDEISEVYYVLYFKKYDKLVIAIGWHNSYDSTSEYEDAEFYIAEGYEVTETKYRRKSNV